MQETKGLSAFLCPSKLSSSSLQPATSTLHDDIVLHKPRAQHQTKMFRCKMKLAEINRISHFRL